MIEQERFQRCLVKVLGHEGGFSDDPRDPGGITNLGVTKSAWEAWVGHSVSSTEMRSLTGDKVSPFYYQKYWLTTSSNVLSPGLDYMVFDCSVNQGPLKARKLLQQALGVPTDGVIGALTLLALKGCNVSETIKKFGFLRGISYEVLSDFDHFGKGWINRLNDVQFQALVWATA